VSFNVQNNPFPGAYLFNFSFQPGAAQPNPNGNVNGLQQPFNGGLSEYQNFLQDSQRNRSLNERKKKNGLLSPENLQRMMLQISQQQSDIDRLKYQIEASKDPSLKNSLQSRLGEKSTNFFSLQNTLSQQFKALSSGFLGSENRTDHVGSFVTFS